MTLSDSAPRFGLGERLVGRLERNFEREADSAIRRLDSGGTAAGSLISGLVAAADGADQIAGRHVLRNDEREIAGHRLQRRRRERRPRPRPVTRGSGSKSSRRSAAISACRCKSSALTTAGCSSPKRGENGLGPRPKLAERPGMPVGPAHRRHCRFAIGAPAASSNARTAALTSKGSKPRALPDCQARELRVAGQTKRERAMLAHP